MDFTHLSEDEKINGINITNVPQYIRTKAYLTDFSETLAQLAEMTIQLGINMGLSPEESLEWAMQISKIDDKADQAFVDSQLSAIVSGAPKGTFTDLTALRTAHPNGTDGIFLVLENGHWYYWNDTSNAWTDGGIYQANSESDFPAKNLINNPLFENDMQYWQVIGATANVTDRTLTLTSTTGQKTIRLTHANTGYKPKANDKLLIGGVINFKDDNFLDARINLRDWVTGGTYRFYENLDVSRPNVDQQVYAYVEVDRDFVDQLRFYIEANLIDANKQSSFTFTKPIILNLTQIFGQGNEPSKSQVIDLLRKHGGWIQDKVDEFLTRKESKLMLLDGQKLTEKVDTLIVNSENTEAEVADARVSSVKNKEYETLSRRIEEVEKDGLMAENLVVNGDFDTSPSTGWVTGGSTHEVINGKLQVSGTGATIYSNASYRSDKTFVVGEKYYVRAYVTPTSETTNEIRLFGVGGTSDYLVIEKNIEMNREIVVSGINDVKSEQKGLFGIQAIYPDSQTAGSSSYTVDKVVWINLTHTFGFGNEPSVEQMDSLLEEKFSSGYFDGTESIVSHKKVLSELNNVKREIAEAGIVDDSEMKKDVQSNKLAIANQYNRNLITTRTPFDYTQTAARTSPKRMIWTITYDDESRSIHQYGLPVHKEENVPACFYIVPNRIGSEEIFNYDVAMNWDELKEFEENGWEIGHHTVNHLNTSYMGEETLRANIEEGNAIFLEHGIVPKHFSHPGGSNTYNNSITLTEYFDSAALTVLGFNGYDMNPWRISRLSADAYPSGMIRKLDELAEKGEGWMITYQHAIHPNGIIGGVKGDQEVWTPTQLRDAIQYAKSLGIEIVTMDEGLRTYAPYMYYFNESLDPAYAVQRDGVIANAKPIIQ